METRRILRIAITGLLVVATPIFYLNVENATARLGYDKVLADAVSPPTNAKPSALVGVLTSPEALYSALLILGLFLGVWLDYFAKRLDTRRSRAPWWAGLQSFTIRDFSCLVADVPPSDFDQSARAQAIAGEIRGYVNSGHMPTMLETPLNSTRLQDYGNPRYERKNVADNAQVLRGDLERLAISRKWKLPWEPQERKTPAKMPIRDGSNALR